MNKTQVIVISAPAECTEEYFSNIISQAKNNGLNIGVTPEILMLLDPNLIGQKLASTAVISQLGISSVVVMTSEKLEIMLRNLFDKERQQATLSIC